MNTSKIEINAIDLFCGAGGLTRGLLDAGIRVKQGFDIDDACEYPYNVNNYGSKFVKRSVEDIGGEEINEKLGTSGVRLVAGCAPCQPFSKYRQGQDTTKDKKWWLLYQFERIVRESEPELVTMENVPELLRHDVFADFRIALEQLRYHVTAEVVDCRSYGIPQHRQRLVLLASKLGPISIPGPTHSPDEYVSVKHAIGHLPPIAAGQQHPGDPLHSAAGLSEINLKRIRQSRPGGNWKDWDPELIAECHRKSTGRTYKSVYGRMRWDEPSPTMTTQCYGFGNGRFGHPEQDRGISLREAAIFQTFPPNYQFSAADKKVQFSSLGRMIGNAVPVKLGEIIGRTLFEHVKNNNKKFFSRNEILTSLKDQDVKDIYEKNTLQNVAKVLKKKMRKKRRQKARHKKSLFVH